MSRILKKRCLSALLAAVLLFPTLLTACKNSEQDDIDGTTADTPTSVDTTDAPDDETTPDEEETTVQLTGPYADSIMYANSTQNDIQVYFKDHASRDVIIENQNGQMILNTLTTGNKQVSALQNTEGKAYLTNTMDVFLRTTDGKTVYASDSPAAGRLNIYRYGYYYYNTHILDQIFAGEDYLKSTDLRADSLPRRGFISDIEFLTAEEGCKFRVTSTTDPYVGLQNLKYATESYNAVEIVMRAEQASTADLFLGVGSHQWPNSDQHVSFAVTPGSEFYTYVVPISSVKDYEGNINSIRIDIGAAVGEIVEIRSFRLVQIDNTIPAISLDRTVHAYSDKLVQETHLVTTAAVTNLAAYGMKTEIAADTVSAMIVKDKNGTHTALDGVDFASLEYIGFDIKEAGVFGYIKTLDEGGTLTVTLADGVYTVIQEITTEAAHKQNTHLYMGTALYTDETHTFDGFLYAADCERNPLTLKVTNTRDGGAFAGYNSLRGAYELTIDGGIGFQHNYENNVRKTLTFEVTGDKADRKVYIYTLAATGETLESAVLLDEYNRLLPIPVEVCKNFGHEKEEPIFEPTDARWGEAYFPFVIEADKKNTLTVVNLYYDWGQFPLKQLSSISYYAPYYHLSTGATESNCIANYFISSMANNLLPDFRGMSQRFWVTQPQHTAAGILNVLTYTDAAGNFNALHHDFDEINAYGPTYADLEMNYTSYDEKIEVILNHIEMPQTDENRTYYTYKIKVLEDVSIADFKKNFTIFSMTSTNTTYKKLGYLNDKNQPAVVDASTTDAIRYITLGSEAPYIDLFVGDHTVHEDGYTNLAAIFKSSQITIGGKDYTGNLILRESLLGGKNHTDITLDLGKITLKAGDTMTFEMILLPWGMGQDNGISENDDIVRRVRMDSCMDPFKIEASVGSVIPHSFVPMVKADGGKAEFTVSGGHDKAVFYTGERENKDKVRGVAVRVYGFDAIGVPVVEEYVNGKWVSVKLASDNYAYDGYYIQYEGDGTYSYSFVVDMTSPDARKFRVSLDTNEKIFASIDPAIPGGGSGADKPVDPDQPIDPDKPVDPTPSDELVIDGVTYTTNCINSLDKMSFDALIKDTKNTLYQEKDGGATAYLAGHPITLDETWECFRVRGWAGYAQGTIVSYGYRINDGELVRCDDAVKPAEEGVVNAGGQSRFTITAPITDITQDHLIRFYIILEDGTSEEMIRFWALGAEA